MQRDNSFEIFNIAVLCVAVCFLNQLKLILDTKVNY